MPVYDEQELQHLIERYRNDMMQRYAVRTANAETSMQPAVPETEDVPKATTEDDADIGTLQVRVSTENLAVPLADAVVTVTQGNKEPHILIRTMNTDASGLTPLIELPTKARTLTLSPGNAQPFSTYTVTVTADGYYAKRFTDIPIYGGVTALQNVSMIPLPEGGSDDRVLSYPQGAPAIT